METYTRPYGDYQIEVSYSNEYRWTYKIMSGNTWIRLCDGFGSKASALRVAKQTVDNL